MTIFDGEERRSHGRRWCAAPAMSVAASITPGRRASGESPGRCGTLTLKESRSS
jgi:hypothetical protein